MGARDPLEILEAAGLTVTVEGESIKVSPASLLTDELRAMVREHKAALVRALITPDDMRSCEQCRNLSRRACSAAARGIPLGWTAPISYRPVFPEMPQRCLGFLPLASDPDQRTGAERWPFLRRSPIHAEQPR